MKLPLKVKYWIAFIIQYTGILLLALATDRFIELTIIVPCFFLFRSKYSSTYHAETFNQCTFYTLVSFAFVCLISAPKSTSVLLSICISFVMTEIFHFMADYFELKKIKKTEISKGMSKAKLLKKCEMSGLDETETKVLVYYYCDGLRRWQIGNILNYSEETIGRIKRKALEKLN